MTTKEKFENLASENNYFVKALRTGNNTYAVIAESYKWQIN